MPGQTPALADVDLYPHDWAVHMLADLTQGWAVRWDRWGCRLNTVEGRRLMLRRGAELSTVFNYTTEFC